ncbi:hypothetical protein [Sphingomonas corticis]|jgi:hypothetical protein|uniref:PAS domain-containing protein n=1 Tax=Sphingomonas corticis TaxID=2722791 RepID=A0ABX1CTK8_9SPHN|nr:hypothetical protein [Sphingomonas corticis]NJR79968.1 hypothetical protein [Sphingomonas corticis]
MDSAHGYDQMGDDRRHDDDPTEGGVGEAEMAIVDERRMHVRAYNHWVSLLGERPFPAIADLDPASIADFGPHSVLLDFTESLENPAIQFLGRALREECGMGDPDASRIADVPARSLLSRLTDHYLQIIANRAPIGFEAEFVGTRGLPTLYRGILMPFSSDAETIDYIYGVINWKELVAPEEEAAIAAELVAARAPQRPDAALAWADGPGAGTPAGAGLAPDHGGTEHGSVDQGGASLEDRLAAARASAAAARAADTRSHAALYRALGRAHDFALAAQQAPAGLEALLADAGIVAQARAPLTAVAKLVFGADHDKTRLTEIATVLAHARRHAVPEGGLPRVLEATPGGIKAIVADERAARRPVKPRAEPAPLARRTTLATVPLATGAAEGEAVVLLGRAAADGTIEVVGAIADARLAGTLMKRIG